MRLILAVAPPLSSTKAVTAGMMVAYRALAASYIPRCTFTPREGSSKTTGSKLTLVCQLARESDPCKGWDGMGWDGVVTRFARMYRVYNVISLGPEGYMGHVMMDGRRKAIPVPNRS